jgi:NAD(P)H-dependent FMN reductase
LLWMDAFSNKPVGLVAHGASVRLCSRPIDALRQVVQTMYGYVAQTSVATCKTDYEASPSGKLALVNDGILERIDRLALELAALCKVLGPQIPKEDDGTAM